MSTRHLIDRLDSIKLQVLVSHQVYHATLAAKLTGAKFSFYPKNYVEPHSSDDLIVEALNHTKEVVWKGTLRDAKKIFPEISPAIVRDYREGNLGLKHNWNTISPKNLKIIWWNCVGIHAKKGH